MNPFFSIIIPTYNRAHLLPETIGSILMQTNNNFEILIIDDGSTDNTRELIRASYSNNEQIFYFWKENAERGSARNFGILKSKGDYIVFLDSDDLMTPDHLKILYERIISSQKQNFYATKSFTINEKNVYKKGPLNNFKEGLYDLVIALEGNPFSCNLCIKKDNPNLKLFREEREFSIIEDWIFLIENLYENNIFIIDSDTILMRDHPHRSMRSDNKIIIRRRLNALNWLIHNYKFNNTQLRTIKGYSYYFCAIHSYLDYNRIHGMKFITMAIKEIGINYKIIIIFLKMILGKKNINYILKYV